MLLGLERGTLLGRLLVGSGVVRRKIQSLLAKLLEERLLMTTRWTTLPRWALPLLPKLMQMLWPPTLPSNQKQFSSLSLLMTLMTPLMIAAISFLLVYPPLPGCRLDVCSVA